MEYRRTALPTCYRIFYYYGDFPVAPSFAQTLEKEKEERDRERYPNQEGKTVCPKKNRDVK